MKIKCLNVVFGVVLGLFVLTAQAAEDFTLWSSETFLPPYDGDVVAVSNVISNNNGLNSVKVMINYEAFAPDRATEINSFTLQAVIEEEIAAGVWTPIAYQFTPINDSTNAPERVITLSPALVIDVGQDNVIYAGGVSIARVSATQGHLPDKFRVKILMDSQGDSAPLTTLTLSGYGRKFDN